MAKIISRPPMGWLPDYPDFRDFTISSDEVRPMMIAMHLEDPLNKEIPGKMDLKKWCSPIENQGDLGSCSANAGVGLLEYYEKRAFGKHIDASRLFLYKTTRNLLHWEGDTGAFLRTTMAAMVLFGIPPAEYWPYDEEKFDEEPPAFCYSFAQNFQALQYFRLDPPNAEGKNVLKNLKVFLANGLPSMFGFTVFSSINDTADTGRIPYPEKGEKNLGGHAVVAIGYDDNMVISHPDSGTKTRGAIKIKNSWGKGWGEKGYGWLPYKFVTERLAEDFWLLLKNEWVDTKQFGL